MKRIINELKLWAVVALIFGLIAGAFWFDFYLWRLQHPAAPAWTFLLRGE